MADFSITGEVRLNSDPAEKSTSKWTVAAGNMIADFAKKAASELGKVVQSGVDYNASMESYLTNFKVMLGNEELAAAKLSELRKKRPRLGLFHTCHLSGPHSNTVPCKRKETSATQRRRLASCARLWYA